MTQQLLNFAGDAPSYQVSPRRKLRPGDRFRTIRGTGPHFRDAAIGEYAVFRCLRIWTRGRRTYAEAQHCRTGAVHDLYLDGPRYTGPAGTIEAPYRITVAKT